jgi:hypothetical protein
MDVSLSMRALVALDTWLRVEGAAGVRIVLVGASAGILTGQLPRGRTTVDCDVMTVLPPDAEGALLRAADEVSVRLGLPPTWLNTDVQLLRHALPDGWEARCAAIHVGDALEVLAIGRIDLVCMKIYAGRPQDLEDLRSMSPTGDELGFARSYVETLRSRGEPDTHVADARAVIAFLGGADGA